MRSAPEKPQWPDDHDCEVPDERTSNVIAWVAVAFALMIVAALTLKGCAK